MVNTTYSCKPSQIQRKWWVIDAKDLVLGRMASLVAITLMGKDKVIYTPHIDCGDYVIIINAEKIYLTGKKQSDKKYYWHTGYPGGIKSVTAQKIIEGKFPERVIRRAVTNMISSGPLGRDRLKKLYIYQGNNHPHQAQKPQIMDIASLNLKNSKRK